MPTAASPLLKVATAAVLATFAAALLAPVIAPYDPVAQDILARLKGPYAAHWLGTDQFGRDVLARVLHGLRSSLAVSFSAVATALLISGSIGLAAAYYRG